MIDQQRGRMQRLCLRFPVQRFFLAALFCKVLLLASPAIAGAWWETRNGDFHIVSKLSKGQTASIARDIQIYQAALANFFPDADIQPRQPVTIFLLDRKLWRQYIAGDLNQAGIAFPADDHFYVVVNGDLWLEASTIVFHELTHVFLHKAFNGRALPVWLDEGYADLLSTIDAGKDQIKVGLFPAWRYYSLQEQPWMPLQTLLEVARDSPEYHSEKLAAAFYAQSWLIVHYQMFSSPQRGKQIREYLSRLSVNESPQRAFATAFPDDHGEFEEELKKYAHQTSFRYLKLTVPGAGKYTGSSITELPAAEATAELGAWMLRHRALDAAAMRILETQAKDAAPASAASLQLALAYVRNQQNELALPRLDAGCASPAASYRAAMLCGDAYALMARAESRSAVPGTDELMLRARQFFTAALGFAPTNTEALIRAAYTYNASGGDADMLLDALEQALARDPRNPSIAMSLATVLQHSDLIKTKDYLERAILNVVSHEQVQYMLGLLQAIEAQIAAAKSAAQTDERTAALDAPQAVQDAFAKVQAKQYAQADKMLEGIMDAPAFQDFKRPLQHEILLAAGMTALRLGATERAYKLLVRSSAMPESRDADWFARYQAAFLRDDMLEAARALTQVAKHWPASLRYADDPTVFRVIRETKKALTQAGVWFDLAQSLYDARWRAANQQQPDWVWGDLVLALLERGSVQRATEVAGQVTSPTVLLSMAMDRRFDPVTTTNAEQFDIPKAAEREFDRLRAGHGSQPRSLDAVSRLVYALVTMHRYEEALQLSDQVLSLSPAARAAAFDDADAWLNWIMNYRARALRGLNRWDESVTQMQQASAQRENGEPNVSQVINLAELHIKLARPREALATLVKVGSSSPFGRMQMEAVKFSAAQAMQDARAAAAALSYLREHQADAPNTFLATLVEADLFDEAAQLLIARLRDPLLRQNALLAMQDYTPPPATPAELPVRAKWQAFQERADVRAAIAEVGRILQLPFEQ